MRLPVCSGRLFTNNLVILRKQTELRAGKRLLGGGILLQDGDPTLVKGNVSLQFSRKGR